MNIRFISKRDIKSSIMKKRELIDFHLFRINEKFYCQKYKLFPYNM